MVGTHDNYAWTTVTSWEIVSAHAMGDYVDIVLGNSSLNTAHIFMYQYIEGFHNACMRENNVDMDIIKLELFLLDENITNTYEAARIQKLKLTIYTLNKFKMVKAKRKCLVANRPHIKRMRVFQEFKSSWSFMPSCRSHVRLWPQKPYKLLLGLNRWCLPGGEKTCLQKGLGTIMAWQMSMLHQSYRCQIRGMVSTLLKFKR